MPSPDAVRAWQAAVQVAVRTRRLLSCLPPRGFAELRDQMIRSSESIGTNIAEGRGSAFEREYIRFLDIAARSANELSSQLTMAMKYGVVPKQQAFNLNGTVTCTRRMIESLRDACSGVIAIDATASAARGATPRIRQRKNRCACATSIDQRLALSNRRFHSLFPIVVSIRSFQSPSTR